MKYLTLMLEDYLIKRNGSRRLAYNDLLTDIGARLENEGTSLIQYGFLEPENLETELDRELHRYDRQEQALYLDTLNQQTPNTDEQQNIFHYVLTALNNSRKELIFIQGMGGSGKSTLTKNLWQQPVLMVTSVLDAPVLD